MLRFLFLRPSSAPVCAAPAAPVSVATVVAALVFAAMMPAVAAHAQSSPAETRLQRTLSKIDVGVSGIVTFTTSTSGSAQNASLQPTPSFTQKATTSAGPLLSGRWQKSPYVGAELNFSFVRFAQDYSCCDYNPNTTTPGPLHVVATANEYTAAYLVRPPHPLFGTQPYISAGGGALEFKPTHNGGQGLPVFTRPVVFYSAGVEAPLTGKLGVRGGIRQLFYQAPSFGQNYLDLKKWVFTTEPQIGLYLRF